MHDGDVDDATERAPDFYGRPGAEHVALKELLTRLGDQGPRDLGGSMSLNLHLEQLGIVLRVHPRFETAARIHALRALRRRLAEHGLTVGTPQPVLGEEVLPVGHWLAEAETFVSATRPPATWESYVWMFRAMGHLHRVTRACASDLQLPPPEVATYGAPAALRRWISMTVSAVSTDEHATALAAAVQSMIGPLERQWTSPDRLPQHVVHGDIRLGNVARAASGDVAYFDFGFSASRARIHDIAYSLFWIVLKPDDSGCAESFDWQRVAELLAAYEHAAGGRLTELERRSIGPYLAAVPMYLAAISSYTPDPCDRIKQEIRSLDIARWVLDHPEELTFSSS